MIENSVTLTTDTVVKRPMTTRVRKFRGKLLLANSSTAYELDEVGAFVIGRVDGRTSVGGIGEKVAAQWDVTVDVATTDVIDMLAPLVENGLIVSTG